MKEYRVSDKDLYYMKRALALAEHGRNAVSPNPMVGAVIVKKGKVIAKGYHAYYGGPHAEVVALSKAGSSAEGADLYVNLEPCTHFGKTPPCCAAIIKSGIKRVFVGCKDPNPVNNGKGLKKLRRAGVVVICSVLEKESLSLNEAFFKHMLTGLPFVSIKVAQSIDGKIATFRRDSKWITSERSRETAHKIRSKHDAILVGINTVLVDDPFLSARKKREFFKNQPVKVVLDSKFRLDLDRNIFSEDSPAKAIIFISDTLKNKYKNKQKIFMDRGNELVFLPLCKRTGFSIKRVLQELGKRGILSLMVEGGGQVIGSFFDAGLADKGYFFISPRIIGGDQAISSVGGRGVKTVKEALPLKNSVIKRLGNEILIEGYF